MSNIENKANTAATENPNVTAWLAGAPADVRDTTERLLAEVAGLRATQAIYPPQDDILNALVFTAPADVRVVILGQDPYHGPGQAMGLSFSVPQGCKLPPSLRNMYKELAADLGCSQPESGDLTSWAAQGVLLLNTTLTVREHAAASHAKLGWQVLTDHVVRRCLELPQPVVFLTWGKHAIDLVAKARAHVAGAASSSRTGSRTVSHAVSGARASEIVAAPTPEGAGVLGLSPLASEGVLANKYVLASTHPSPLSANRATATLPAFMGSRPYSQVNRILQQEGEPPINWQSVLG